MEAWRLLKPILILPGTVLVLMPAVILFASNSTRFSTKPIGPEHLLFWLASAAAVPGLFLAVWTVTLFIRFGQGTPAPWDPPLKLVLHGPYRFVRNPMITAVLLILLAETLIFQSWPLFFWMILFFLANAIYFPLVEERSLAERFGTAYLEYKKHVPRWIPRLTPWDPLEKEQE